MIDAVNIDRDKILRIGTPSSRFFEDFPEVCEKRGKDKEKINETRLKNVNVMAYTLDGYINRYMDSKLDVEHIFFDEAGYTNIIKVLTLFNHDVSITLLVTICSFILFVRLILRI
jgi:hypothetical protein